MTDVSGKPPMRDFEAFMRERISKYEPLERFDEPRDAPRLSQAQIGEFFAKERAVFADRSAAQEQKSFEAFFVRQNLHRERDTAGNLDALLKNPAYKDRSNEDLEKVARLRTVLTDSMDKKGVGLPQQRAMLEKFDVVYQNPRALDKIQNEMDRSMDFTKTHEQARSADNEISL
ncbi:MAG: hypothetical protein PHF20_01305 [Halothiobacillaceae bacterium]|nr:hypothetical protein [Halothiobacillaceae bacterium]